MSSYVDDICYLSPMSEKSYTLIKQWEEQKFARSAANAEYLHELSINKPRITPELQQTHEEVFAEVDCLACANCCKTTPPLYTTKDVKRIARHLGISPKQFKNKYIIEDINGDLVGIRVPCSFLNEDNTCSIYEVRPMACRTYPHTDDPAFVSRPDMNHQNTIVCPAAFHIVERLRSLHTADNS